jgi:hypothetical protein
MSADMSPGDWTVVGALVVLPLLATIFLGLLMRSLIDSESSLWCYGWCSW